MHQNDKELFLDYATPLVMGGCTVAYAHLGYQCLKEGDVGGAIGCAAGATVSAGATVLGTYNFIKTRFGNGKLLWD